MRVANLTNLILKALPLAASLFMVAAKDDGCVININSEGEGEGEVECVDLGDICPALSCENGNVLDNDGCPICECNGVSICDATDIAIPECANPIFDESTCSWFCGEPPVTCFSDADCGAGFICDFSGGGGAVPPNGGADQAPIAGGICVAAPPVNCFSDFDCGDGFFCDFSGGGAADPGAPEERPAPPPDGGICAPIAQPGCFSDLDCAPGFVCQFAAADAAVALDGQCVPAAVNCATDADCAESQHCELLDAAGGLVILPSGGICVDDVIICTLDADCPSGQVCSVDGSSGGAADRAIPCLDADGDGICDGIVPPTGQCIPVIIDSSCESDADCVDGQFCDLSNTDGCVCADICIDDGNGGCVPCACPAPVGVCSDIPVDNQCFSDADCADGTLCTIVGTTGCENVPCEVDPTTGEMFCHPCDPIPVSICLAAPVACFNDGDCAADEVCVFDNAEPACDPNTDPACANRPIVAQQGVCKAAIPTDPCSTVRCTADTTCVIDADGSATCVALGADCSSDSDCGAGQLCDAATACLPDPSCDPNTNCDALCFGHCFDAPTP